MRIIFSGLIAIHGIIHLIGFAKEWNLAPVERFSGRTIVHFSDSGLKFMGILWLIACLMMISTSFLYFNRKEWFWIPAILGVVISQLLIILYWHDARWGTVMNLIILAVIISAVASVQFRSMVANEVSYLNDSSAKQSLSLKDEQIKGLPPIVQKWLINSRIVDHEFPNRVHIVQQGSMRTSQHGEWMPFDADQYFTINPPGFVWSAQIHTDKFIDIVGRDKFQGGKGNMLIKVASLISIANSSGNEIDQGTMIRYMAELIWFPHGAVSEYLHWEEIESDKARVTMNYNNIIVSGVYTFNKEGFPMQFEAQRFGDFDGEFRKEVWSVDITEYQYFNGIPIGNKSEVTWKLKDGDFTWLKMEVLMVE